MAEPAGARKHEQLRERLRADIEDRSPHAPLPTERDLASQYGVSRTTVRQALDALAEVGAIYRVQGAGTFVASPMISKSLSLTSFSEDMLARGLRPDSQLLAVDMIPAGRRLAALLQLDEQDDVVRINRLRRADGSPMCLETAHLPADRVPGLLAVDQLDAPFSGSLYQLLERAYGLRVVRAEQVLQSVELGESDAALLGVSPGAAGMRVCRTGLDDRDRPVEATTSVYRADRYDIRFTVRRSTAGAEQR